MKTLTNRRDAIKTTLAAGLAAMIPSFTLKAENFSPNDSEVLIKETNCYLVKHGHPLNDSRYLWSILTVSNESLFLSQIQAIMNSNKYFTKMSYSSNDKFKVVPAKQIIDLILNKTSGVSFEMTLFSGNTSQFKDLKPSASNQKKTQLYSNLLANKSNHKVISKSEDRFGPSEAYNEKFLEIHNVNHEAVNVKSNIILQINDLISGICYAILANSDIHSSAKLELNAYFDLKTNLSTKKDDNNINLTNIKIKKSNVV
jgi:hypothetical protein